MAIQGHPCADGVKGHWLAAACAKAAALAVIDLKEDKVVGSVPLPGRVLLDLFCSQADNSYVYVICDPDKNANLVPAGHAGVAIV